MAGITKTGKVTHGETLTITFSSIKNQAGAVIDFTGGTVTYRISSAQGGGTTILSKTVGSGISTPSTSFVVTLANTDTDITAGLYWHECKAVVGGVTYQVLDPSPFYILASSIA